MLPTRIWAMFRSWKVGVNIGRRRRRMERNNMDDEKPKKRAICPRCGELNWKPPTYYQKKIFDEGFTTKKEGSGLGLYICRQNLAEQFCELTLMKSTSALTVFEIKMNKV